MPHNAHFAKRNTKEPTLLQGILVCRECGYACYRTSTRTTNKRIYYYRCIGSDDYRHIGGASATAARSAPTSSTRSSGTRSAGCSRDPAARPRRDRPPPDRAATEHPAARRREALERDLTRASGAIERLIEAYQEQLISLEELRARMPDAAQAPEHAPRPARQRSTQSCTTPRPTSSSPTPSKGSSAASPTASISSSIAEQQRVLRLVVREVLIGGDDDTITIRHSIPTPTGGPDDPSYLLRGSSHHPALGSSLLGRGEPHRRSRPPSTIPGPSPSRGTYRAGEGCGHARSGRTPLPGPRQAPNAAWAVAPTVQKIAAIASWQARPGRNP